MHNVGDRLYPKKTIPIIEIIGIYPSGQGGLKENDYVVMWDGSTFRMSESMLGNMFSTDEPKSEPSKPLPKSQKKVEQE